MTIRCLHGNCWKLEEIKLLMIMMLVQMIVSQWKAGAGLPLSSVKSDNKDQKPLLEWKKTSGASCLRGFGATPVWTLVAGLINSVSGLFLVLSGNSWIVLKIWCLAADLPGRSWKDHESIFHFETWKRTLVLTEVGVIEDQSLKCFHTLWLRQIFYVLDFCFWSEVLWDGQAVV